MNTTNTMPSIRKSSCGVPFEAPRVLDFGGDNTGILVAVQPSGSAEADTDDDTAGANGRNTVCTA